MARGKTNKAKTTSKWNKCYRVNTEICKYVHIIIQTYVHELLCVCEREKRVCDENKRKK